MRGAHAGCSPVVASTGSQGSHIAGIEVGFGGVWVAAAPDILFLPDRNEDDILDGEP